MRAHKCITEMKESFGYNFDVIGQPEMELIVSHLLEGMKENRVKMPIIDITNRLGFTVYQFPFTKEGCIQPVKAFFGINAEFSMNENSNYFLIEKNMSNEDKRFFVAYLLAHYLLDIDERHTDFFQLAVTKKDIKNNPYTRLALTLLMPENIFRAQLEFLQASYRVANRENELNPKMTIYRLSRIFQVTPNMVRARMIQLNISLVNKKKIEEVLEEATSNE